MKKYVIILISVLTFSNNVSFSFNEKTKTTSKESESSSVESSIEHSKQKWF